MATTAPEASGRVSSHRQVPRSAAAGHQYHSSSSSSASMMTTNSKDKQATVDELADAGAAQSRRFRKERERLPNGELAAYAVWFAAVLAVSGYQFRSQVSYSSISELDPTSLRDGFFGYKMDNTYMDLNYFLNSFFSMLGVLTLHLAVSWFTRRFFHFQIHQLACALFTLALSCQLLSVRCTLLLICLHLSCCLAACLTLAPPQWAVWAIVLLAFGRFSGAAYGPRLRTELGLDARGAHLFYPIAGYLYCRFLSMGLCLAARARQHRSDAAAATAAAAANSGVTHGWRRVLRSLPAALHYAFYLPNFLGAPVVTMEEFLLQVEPISAAQPTPGGGGVRTPNHSRLDLLSRACRLTLWLAVTLAIVHCLPAGAYLETAGLLLVRTRQPIGFAQAAFAMYTRGQLFMLEYVQYYGWPALFASLDGVQLPHWPACICRIASYREMWRLFDRGLFAIVRSHIYVPLGGSRCGPARQALATVASFAFICVYHGNYDSVQAWILLNLGLVLTELLAIRAYKVYGLEEALLKWMSPRCLRRLIGCVAAANLIPPSLAVFYFFYGTYAGNLLTREILWKPLTGQSSIAGFAVFCATFYCSVQMGIEYKLRFGDANKD